jgi:hypothetical protein
MRLHLFPETNGPMKYGDEQWQWYRNIRLQSVATMRAAKEEEERLYDEWRQQKEN